jgi:hypothetical protein
MSIQLSDIGFKFFIGCLGSLYAVYTHLTSELPGIKPSIELKKIKDQIDDLELRFDEIGEAVEEARKKLENGDLVNTVFKDLSDSWNEERDDIDKKRHNLSITYENRRNSLKMQAALLFLIIGGSVAALFTQGILITDTGLNYQTIIAALAIGFAGPGYISKLSELKTEEDIQRYTQERKNDILEEMKNSFETSISKLVEENQSLKKNYDLISGEATKLNDTIEKYDNAIKAAKKIIDEQDEYITAIIDSIKSIEDSNLLDELKKIDVIGELLNE